MRALRFLVLNEDSGVHSSLENNLKITRQITYADKKPSLEFCSEHIPDGSEFPDTAGDFPVCEQGPGARGNRKG